MSRSHKTIRLWRNEEWESKFPADASIVWITTQNVWNFLRQAIDHDLYIARDHDLYMLVIMICTCWPEQVSSFQASSFTHSKASKHSVSSTPVMHPACPAVFARTPPLALLSGRPMADGPWPDILWTYSAQRGTAENLFSFWPEDTFDIGAQLV